jgi:hypothetical protein
LFDEKTRTITASDQAAPKDVKILLHTLLSSMMEDDDE